MSKINSKSNFHTQDENDHGQIDPNSHHQVGKTTRAIQLKTLINEADSESKTFMSLPDEEPFDFTLLAGSVDTDMDSGVQSLEPRDKGLGKEQSQGEKVDFAAVASELQALIDSLGPADLDSLGLESLDSDEVLVAQRRPSGVVRLCACGGGGGGGYRGGGGGGGARGGGGGRGRVPKRVAPQQDLQRVNRDVLIQDGVNWLKEAGGGTPIRTPTASGGYNLRVINGKNGRLIRVDGQHPGSTGSHIHYQMTSDGGKSWQDRSGFPHQTNLRGRAAEN